MSQQTEPARWYGTSRIRRFLHYLVLTGCVLVTVALRLHTVTEPVDCDEATYGYVAWRVLNGARLYADVFENKPPLAYAPYAIAVAVGGYTETAIRLLPIPFVLVTLFAVWRAGAWLSRSEAGALAAALSFTVIQSDPFVFGNGANLEIYMNACLAVAFWLAVRSAAAGKSSLATAFWIGLLVGAATAIKQVAAVFLIPALIATGWGPLASRNWRSLLPRWATLVLGALVPWILCAGFCLAQGVFWEFIDAVFVYAPEVARHASERTLRDYQILLSAERVPVLPGLAAATGDASVRTLLYTTLFFSGNPLANAWWATGTWPIAVLAVVAVVRGFRTGGASGLIFGVWAVATTAAICWPGLFWQHYYMLYLPLFAVGVGDELADLRNIWVATKLRGGFAKLVGRAYVTAVLFAVPAVAVLQAYFYLGRAPEEITERYKGGLQWVALRKTGQSLRQQLGEGRNLFVWGWQSPLYLYTNWTAPTPYFFTDPLMQEFVSRPHPMVDRRKRRILEDLRKNPPDVIFVGESPFQGLVLFLTDGYIGVTNVVPDRGLFVRIGVLRERLWIR